MRTAVCCRLREAGYDRGWIEVWGTRNWAAPQELLLF